MSQGAVLVLIALYVEDNSNDVSATTSKSHQTTTEKSTGYGGIILTAAVVLGASSLLISNYQTIKVHSQSLNLLIIIILVLCQEIIYY